MAENISTNQQIGATSSREKMEKIMSITQQNTWSKHWLSPAWMTATEPLHRIQNAAVHLVFNLPKCAPLLRDLH